MNDPIPSADAPEMSGTQAPVDHRRLDSEGHMQQCDTRFGRTCTCLVTMKERAVARATAESLRGSSVLDRLRRWVASDHFDGFCLGLAVGTLPLLGLAWWGVLG